jgi:hypothetical protein
MNAKRGVERKDPCVVARDAIGYDPVRPCAAAS